MFRFVLSFLFVFALAVPALGQTTAADADFDGSGTVDFPDFLQLVNAFGSSAGDDKYNEKFDFDGSGSIDFPDFLQFVNVFGQTVPVDEGSVDGDRAALIALYNATDGANWTDNTNWLSDKTLGEWHGVSTNAQGRVVTLRLQKNQLSGPIPPELGKLSKLQRLNLYNNKLSGPIPPEIGNLSNLRELELSINQLSGPIPPEIGNLSNLEWLFLYNNKLSGPIPLSFGKLSTLKQLGTGGNPGLCYPPDFVNWGFALRLCLS